MHVLTDTATAIRAALDDRLSDARRAHALSVTEFAIGAASASGVDRADAELAALLHDLCRCTIRQDLLDSAEEYGLPISAFQRNNPMLLHGPVAAEEGRRIFGVENPDVYHAVYWHTTGCHPWSRVGELLYLADFSEPLRNYPEAAHARAVLEHEGFDAAVQYVAECKYRHSAGKAIPPEALGFLRAMRARNA